MQLRQEEVLVAIDSKLGAGVGAEESTILSISGNEGRIAQLWVNEKAWLHPEEETVPKLNNWFEK